ncbi:MAG: hypothetical protein ACI4DW_07810 [Lachnospiraceae bacterium]
MHFAALTIGSIFVMCISGVGLIITLAYFAGHFTYLYGFENSRETIAIIKEFYHDYEVSYERNDEPILEYYNEFTGKTVQKQLMNTKLSSANASVGDLIRIQYTSKKERIIEPKYITENTYRIQKYITPLLICAIVCFISFILLIISIMLDKVWG